jgi:hypothetical protein
VKTISKVYDYVCITFLKYKIIETSERVKKDVSEMTELHLLCTRRGRIAIDKDSKSF